MDNERIKQMLDDLLDYALETTDAQALIEYLERKGYSDGELEEAGLI